MNPIARLALPLDRLLPVPEFYVLAGASPHRMLQGRVVTESAIHGMAGWITVGVVSSVTPYGQGIYAGVDATLLRPATPSEIRQALALHHPRGSTYRPAALTPAMRSALGHWSRVTWRQTRAILQSLP